MTQIKVGWLRIWRVIKKIRVANKYLKTVQKTMAFMRSSVFVSECYEQILGYKW